MCSFGHRAGAALGLLAGFLLVWLRFLICEQLLRGLFHLLEQPPVIARLLNGRLQLLAQMGEPFEPLLAREIDPPRHLRYTASSAFPLR